MGFHETVLRSATKAGAAKSAQATGDLPEWDLTHLYPGIESQAFKGDLERGLAEAQTLAGRYRGKLGDLAAAPDASETLAAAYLAQDDEMRRSVAQIIDDIGRAKVLRFRLPSDEAARLMLTVWESSAVRAAMAGLDYEEMCRRTNAELARVAELIIEPSAG